MILQKSFLFAHRGLAFLEVMQILNVGHKVYFIIRLLILMLRRPNMYSITSKGTYKAG